MRTFKSVSFVDGAGRRFGYPAVFVDLPYTDVTGAVDALRRSGYSLRRLQGSRAVLCKGREIRYICAL